MIRSFIWTFERFLSQSKIRLPLIFAITLTLLYLNLGLPHLTLLQGEGGSKELFYNKARLKLLHHAEIEEGEASAFLYRVRYDKGFLPLKFISLKASHCLTDISFESLDGLKESVSYPEECVRDGSIRLEIPEKFKYSTFDLVFTIKNASHSRSIHLQYFYGWPFVAAFCVLLTLISLVLFHFLRFETRYIRYLLPLGFQFYASNFLSLDIDAWSYDSLGHLDHVKTVLSGNLIPKDICWECFQPPLSYWMSALFYKVYFWGTLLSVAAASRLSSLLCFLVFLYFGFKYIQLYLRKSYSRVLVAALIVFLPASIIHADRVGNESFFYAAFMAALYYLSRFFLYQSFRDLRYYTWSTIVALFTKATAMVMGPISFFVLLLELKTLSISKNKRTLLRGLGPFIVFIPLFFIMQRYKANLIQRLGAMNSELGVKNSFENLYGIDIRDFFNHAFTDTWNDLGGRQYFWNFYLKSMTWGEFDWGGVEYYARVWNVFCLLLVFYSIIAFRFYYQKQKSEKSRDFSLGIPLVALFTCVLSSFAYRLMYPLSPMQDFRFLFPVVFPAGVIFVRFSDAISTRVTLFILGFASILLTLIWVKILYL